LVFSYSDVTVLFGVFPLHNFSDLKSFCLHSFWLDEDITGFPFMTHAIGFSRIAAD